MDSNIINNSQEGWYDLMNAEQKGRNYYSEAKSQTIKLARDYSQHRKWINCPKCIGGNMYREFNGDYICLQCGCSYYPDTAENVTH
jgi:NADH pyrophosphatase NudC (nudix superfamily)